ncbi:beta-glucosidase 6 [Amylocarpus encephaloides]|uniref:glucan 1,3-beta-glucosidase n=1 Tax=Amylocarpus encephaloides TaxID=45428 RepID=A0A9P7YSG3_9HELO|nr:beta-glucosidase 6 [Amylocarpus encephaloides]
MAPQESPRRKHRDRDRDCEQHRERRRRNSDIPKRSRHQPVSSESSSQALSADSLAKLNLINQQERTGAQEVTPKKTRRKRQPEIVNEKVVVERSRRQHKRKKRRVVSGALLEEGKSQKLKGLRGGYVSDGGSDNARKKKRLWLLIGIVLVILVIIIVVAVVVSNIKKGSSNKASAVSTSDSGAPSNSNLNGVSESSVPASAKGTDLDPFSWFDTTDFNVTYTAETTGDLPIMGLNSTWDDSKAANENVPAIATAWGSYATRPARGVNLGGWFSLEPFITPSLFTAGTVDEWTLTTALGSNAKSTLEKHYATFVSEQTFIDIANAGLDHVRIPFSYWAIVTYPGDPYVFRVSWRYLLRGIEWARKHGLRINLDPHGIPGSQNGWNHSGRLGAIGWLNGKDGALNGQRALDMHDRLSKFFSQPRYKNIITFYGLANEPKMTALEEEAVLDWTSSAYTLVRKNGITANVVFGDGFMGLENWKGKLTGMEGLVLDVHQYVIFNSGQIGYNHAKKVDYACSGWTEQTQISMNVATGFGPTIFAEWSQADTDCAPNLNNVGAGTRWEGNYNVGDAATAVTKPGCPTKNSDCSCKSANAPSSSYSAAYKQFLQMFAEAQMTSFEEGWGWFYWTWKTEAATQWSYQLGLAAGILPAKAYARQYNCTPNAPNFSGIPETY